LIDTQRRLRAAFAFSVRSRAMVSVPLPLAYRLLNHGPATLITARAQGRSNVMAAQWVMPIDYDPPKLAVVIDGTTYTRSLVDASGVLGVCIPERTQAQLTWQVGSTSGAEHDKLASIETFAGSALDIPLVAGCLAWLECRVVEVLAERDLFIVEVVAAAADDRYWDGKHVRLDRVQTLHHLGGGQFVASGERVDGRA
jgi:flavin reductase (DIM6/NTAB) family NADH-FMN oxidoreductase RutF